MCVCSFSCHEFGHPTYHFDRFKLDGPPPSKLCALASSNGGGGSCRPTIVWLLDMYNIIMKDRSISPQRYYFLV